MSSKRKNISNFFATQPLDQESDDETEDYDSCDSATDPLDLKSRARARGSAHEDFLSGELDMYDYKNKKNKLKLKNNKDYQLKTIKNRKNEIDTSNRRFSSSNTTMKPCGCSCLLVIIAILIFFLYELSIINTCRIEKTKVVLKDQDRINDNKCCKTYFDKWLGAGRSQSSDFRSLENSNKKIVFSEFENDLEKHKISNEVETDKMQDWGEVRSKISSSFENENIISNEDEMFQNIEERGDYCEEIDRKLCKLAEQRIEEGLFQLILVCFVKQQQIYDFLTFKNMYMNGFLGIAFLFILNLLKDFYVQKSHIEMEERSRKTMSDAIQQAFELNQKRSEQVYEQRNHNKYGQLKYK